MKYRLQAVAQSLPVSVLDLVATRAGEPAGSAIARSVELARQVERLAYKRYWVAEHHSIQGLACSATPVLIGHIAATTKTIRVGSGGDRLTIPSEIESLCIKHAEHGPLQQDSPHVYRSS